jgi:hypothetical protein
MSLYTRQLPLVALSTLILSVFLAGCEPDPYATKYKVPGAEGSAEVKEIFTHKGCTMFRAYVDGERLYYVHCTEGTTTTQWWRKSGKTRRLVRIDQDQTQGE